jgi:sugar/nucleoside kinase (ribokinase family)
MPPMADSDPPPSIDYLIIGHLAKDLTPSGYRLGGTVAYAGLTAANLGWQVGLLSAVEAGLDLSDLTNAGIRLYCLESTQSTEFENIYTAGGRQQRLRGQARGLNLEDVPRPWRSATIVHLAPIADELDRRLIGLGEDHFLGLTPQGWLRIWDEHGMVSLSAWPRIGDLCSHADAVVLSAEDLQQDPQAPAALAERCLVLAVTNGHAPVRLFVEGVETAHAPPPTGEVDPTGAGDIFAAVFFTVLCRTADPALAVNRACQVAARSVTRVGLQSVPDQEEWPMLQRRPAP